MIAAGSGSRTVPYAGGSLDRAAGPRKDPAWVALALASPAARVVPLWRDAVLVDSAERAPVVLRAAGAGAALAAGEPVLLGLDGAAATFALDLSALEESQALALVDAAAALDVRALFGKLSAAEAALLAYARGLLRWHRDQRFCGACGGPTANRDGGHARVCRGRCGKLLFPRIEPSVIVLVEAPAPPARCLLARHRGAASRDFSALAGFLEIGESLEDGVRREVAEEAGIPLVSVAYQASQPWPFPAGLMVGFRAVAGSETVAVDGDELAEARWFSRADVRRLVAEQPDAPRLFNPDSIEKLLIDTWLSEGS